MLQIRHVIELQALHDAEAVAQRRSQRAGARGGTDQRKRRQVELDGARRRAFADHNIQLIIFHRRIEHLFHHRRETVDLINKQHVVRFEIGQHRRQIARLLQHRAGGGAQIDAHLIGDNIGQRGFPQPRRAENQQVIQRIAAQFRRLDENFHLLAHLRLAHILREQLRADSAVEILFFVIAGGGDQTVSFDHDLPQMAARRASRIRVSQSASGLPTLLIIRLASCGL